MLWMAGVRTQGRCYEVLLREQRDGFHALRKVLEWAGGWMRDIVRCAMEILFQPIGGAVGLDEGKSTDQGFAEEFRGDEGAGGGFVPSGIKME